MGTDRNILCQWYDKISEPNKFLDKDNTHWLINCLLSPCKFLSSAIVLFDFNEYSTWTVCSLKDKFSFALTLSPANLLKWFLVLYHEKQCHSYFCVLQAAPDTVDISYSSLQIWLSYLRNPTLHNLSPPSCLALVLFWICWLYNILSWNGTGRGE